MTVYVHHTSLFCLLTFNIQLANLSNFMKSFITIVSFMFYFEMIQIEIGGRKLSYESLFLFKQAE